jgi:MFS family permease
MLGGVTRAQFIVGALAITETTSYGIVFYGFGTSLPAMQNELGWSKVQFSGAFSMALLLSGMVGLLVGRHLDHHDPRPVMGGGSVLAVIGTLLWSNAHTLFTYYLAWGVIGVAMGMILYEPAFVVVTQWFTGESLRKALTAVTLLAGLASTIFVPLEERLIRAYGWRHALVILAVVLAVITIPLHVLVLRPAPDGGEVISGSKAPVAIEADIAPAVHMTTAEARSDRRFQILVAASTLLAVTFGAMIAHQIAFLEERSWVAKDAAIATGAIGLWQVAGRAVFAPLSGRVSSRVITTLTYGTQFVSLSLLLFSTSKSVVAVYVALAGIARGMSTLVRTTLVAQLFGTRNFGAISSVIAMANAIAQAIGPLLAGVIRELPGGYTTMIWVLVLISAVATVLASQVEARHAGWLPAPRVDLM